MNLDNYHISTRRVGGMFVYYYSPEYPGNPESEDSEILITTRFISLSTLVRLASEHHARRSLNA